jgi:2Fe-2S ferredoxin
MRAAEGLGHRCRWPWGFFPMVTVHVEPAGVDVEVDDGQSIMAAAEGQGIFWPTICHGLAECHTCFFEVVGGEDYLELPNALEEAALRQFAGRSWYEGKIIRLACQTRVRGPVSVRKPGVRRAS